MQTASSAMLPGKLRRTNSQPRATPATSAEEQKAATAQDYPMFSQPMTSDQVVGALQGAPDVIKA